jgi:AcrR family transcriptional regulator
MRASPLSSGRKKGTETLSGSKRMAKEERRRQLLETALAIVRKEGTDALTLGRLAERAGVTKPIAYQHFGTRDGLLMALCRDYDDRTTERMRAALKSGGRSLEDFAAILSAAYIDCVLSMGPEYGALFDALSGTEELEAFRRSLNAVYVAEYRKALAPFVALPPKKIEALLTGTLAAAATLSQEAAARRLSRSEALNALTRIMVGAFKGDRR